MKKYEIIKTFTCKSFELNFKIEIKSFFKDFSKIFFSEMNYYDLLNNNLSAFN